MGGVGGCSMSSTVYLGLTPSSRFISLLAFVVKCAPAGASGCKRIHHKT